MSRTPYMYQRRRVAEAPASPTADRSRAATRNWKAKSARKTIATEPACEVASQFSCAGHEIPGGGRPLNPVDRVTAVQVSRIGRRRSPAVIARATRTPIELARHAQ